MALTRMVLSGACFMPFTVMMSVTAVVSVAEASSEDVTAEVVTAAAVVVCDVLLPADVTAVVCAADVPDDVFGTVFLPLLVSEEHFDAPDIMIITAATQPRNVSLRRLYLSIFFLILR